MATLSAPLYKVLAAFIGERLGLHWADAEGDVMGDKLAAHALEVGFTSLLDYYYFLRYDDESGQALAALAEALVVNESYLFRELEPLAVLVRRFLVPWVKAGRRPRVWSAACASGEEPLTLAMLLDDAGVLGGVELVASDLSKRVLARAQIGRYSRRALRRPPPVTCLRYLEVDADGVQVSPALVRAISWKSCNLVDDAAIAALGPFDLVLCRNVLIYFDDATCLRVVNSLAGVLPPAGLLLIGVSESLLRLPTPFECVEHDGVFMYRRTT